MKRNIVLMLVIGLAGLLKMQTTNGCTNFLVTKGASVNGS